MSTSLKPFLDVSNSVLYTVRNISTKEIAGDDYLADDAFLTMLTLNGRDECDYWVFYVTQSKSRTPWEEPQEDVDPPRPRLHLIQGGKA